MNALANLPRILLVDSNVYFAKRVGEALQQVGFEVVPCTQAAYALTMLEWNAPAAILCATNLREMGALEMAPILRADPNTAHIPLIAIGGSGAGAGEQALLEAYRAGCDDFVDRRRSPSDIAAHVRSYKPGGFTTKPEHMPAAHRAHAEWSPSRLIGWAATIGPSTATLVESILASRRHPEHGYRSCLGLLRLSKRYGQNRLEAACVRALAAGARSYKHVASILEHRLDQVGDGESVTTTASRPTHENVRGRNYYH